MAIIHIIPVNDTKEHEEETTCHCNPRVDVVEGGMIVVHNAYDGRVAVEKAQAILDKESGDGTP